MAGNNEELGLGRGDLNFDGLGQIEISPRRCSQPLRIPRSPKEGGCGKTAETKQMQS
jgi:hypothetical protein